MRTLCRFVVLAAVVLATSCGGSDDATVSTSPPDLPSDTPAATEVDGVPTDDTTTATVPTTATSPESGVFELSELAGIETITVLTPPVGNGERPLLAWEAVDGAARYTLTLSVPDGAAYFSWTGATTSIWLGGTTTEPSADAAGPILLTELVLRVVAFDTTGAIVAASPPTSIAP